MRRCTCSGSGEPWHYARRHKRLLVELACVAAPYVLVVAAFPGWYGGSTPGRYLAPLVFPLAVMVAPLWSRQDDFGRCMSVALLMVSVLIACAFGFGAGGMLAYNSSDGRSALLDWVAPTVNLPGGFPSYFRAIPPEGPARGSLSRVGAPCRYLGHHLDRDLVPFALDSRSMCT